MAYGRRSQPGALLRAATVSISAGGTYLCRMSFIQTDAYTIRGYECDASGQLSLPTLMNWMQESANRNAIDYGIGIDDLVRQNLGWMLMRFRLQMHQYPVYGQLVRVITYPTLVEKYFIYRDFRVLADDGTLLAEATSTWLVFDTQKRTMAPLPGFIRALTVPTTIAPLPKLALKPDFQAAPWPMPDQQESSVTVNWFSIDQNQHVNNVAYVQWLLEAVDKTTLKTRKLAELDVLYRTESHWPDQLLIQSAPTDAGTIRHRIIQAETGRDVLLAETRFI